LKVLKRAEDAVKEATPYLLTPLEIWLLWCQELFWWGMKVQQQLLQNSTTTALYGKFNPVIKNSFLPK
jgi:hypothetical protein